MFIKGTFAPVYRDRVLPAMLQGGDHSARSPRGGVKVCLDANTLYMKGHNSRTVAIPVKACVCDDSSWIAKAQNVTDWCLESCQLRRTGIFQSENYYTVKKMCLMS